MHLLGQLSNPSAPLETVVDVLPDEALEPIEHPAPEPETGRLGNGVVQRAVVKVLADGKPQKLAKIRQGVEELIGEPVSIDSVSWCLRTGSRKETPTFVQPTRGHYQLGPQT